jgi:hypothetical protein
MSFVPEKLPLKSLNKTLFSHQLRKADKALHAFDKLLQTAPKPQLLFSSLSYLESLAALESQKIFSPRRFSPLIPQTLSQKKEADPHYLLPYRPQKSLPQHLYYHA